METTAKSSWDDDLYSEIQLENENAFDNCAVNGKLD